MLFNQRLEFNGIRGRLISSIGKRIFMVGYVLLLNNGRKHVWVSASSTLIVIICRIIMLEGLLLALVTEVDIVKIVTNIYILSKYLTFISFFRGIYVQRRVMEMTQQVRGRVMVRIIIWLI